LEQLLEPGLVDGAVSGTTGRQTNAGLETGSVQTVIGVFDTNRFSILMLTGSSYELLCPPYDSTLKVSFCARSVSITALISDSNVCSLGATDPEVLPSAVLSDAAGKNPADNWLLTGRFALDTV